MNKLIYKDEDAEVIRMVNANAYRSRMKERKLCLEDVQREPDHEEAGHMMLTRLGAAGMRMGVGLIFIGGMVRGLMDPVFAMVAAGACVVWGLRAYRRARDV